MPPVANSCTPARAASHMVAATVVAPSVPRATGTARSRVESLSTPSAMASRSISAAPIPTRGTPWTTPTVAGVAPPSVTACSIARPTSRLRGRGSPWASTVDSSATTGRRPASAAATGDEVRIIGIGCECGG
jgi:hypothetical protein